MTSRALYAAKDALAALHRRSPRLRGLLTATSLGLRRRFGWETTYREAGYHVPVPVTYSIRSADAGADIPSRVSADGGPERHSVEGELARVAVSLDLTGLGGRGFTEVVVMDELGARHFDRYEDSDGRVLRGDEIGTWDEVTAARASFVSTAHRVAFSVGQVEGARLFRGRELVGLASGVDRFRLLAPSGPAGVQSRAAHREGLVSSVLLVYPFFRRSLDRSRFRFPPLGPAYVAASVRQAGHEVRLLDCTFLRRDEALQMALAARADVVGIYCMATMLDDCLWFAERLRGRCALLVAGGPLPTCEPEAFLRHFDVVVRGEGEATMVELLAAHESGAELGCGAGRRDARRRTGRSAPLCRRPRRPALPRP